MVFPAQAGVFPIRLGLDARALVFPAQAGVFPIPSASFCLRVCLPRASGGVSPATSPRERAGGSSPRKRGCFSYLPTSYTVRLVFPAQAGVFPTSSRRAASQGSLPRASGGVSTVQPASVRLLPSSPRKRGCFFKDGNFYAVEKVFPAQAGVFLKMVNAPSFSICLPRASGGVSLHRRFAEYTTTSSPRKRGCFWQSTITVHGTTVFPAQAGVFLWVDLPGCHTCSLPRASGGVSAVDK